MYHPTTRVLAVLEMLQTHGRMSGSEMASRLGVDTRTLRRYIRRLEDLGIPITADRGRFGAYSLVAGFKLPPMMFTRDEAVALTVGLIAARGLGITDAAPAVASAQAKLERVMPAGLTRKVRDLDRTVTLALRSSSSRADTSAALVPLSAAAHDRKRVQLSYRTPAGKDSDRDFDPYGLVYRGGSWYVVGHCHLRRDTRSFRLDRIRRVTEREERFERPRDFDALAYLVQSVATIPRKHAIEVLLRTDLDTARRELFESIGVLEPAEGGVLLRGQADDLNWFARELSRVPFEFTIRAPKALRTALRAHAEKLGTRAEG